MSLVCIDGCFLNFSFNNMTELIQQSALSIAKQTKKQKNPKISSPTRALMKKRREMIENKTHRDHIEYVEICKTIKKKAKEDIRKHKKQLRHLRA